MIDLHCHGLPQIDDGPDSIKEAIEMIKEAEKAGYSEIFLTSHYIEGAIEESVHKKELLLNHLQFKVYEKQVDVKLYCGSEVYISPNIHDLVINKEVQLLNNNRYLLLELPMENKVGYLEEVIFKIMCLGVTPIIAHPERCVYIQQDPDMLTELIEKGVLFQLNCGSLVGLYGEETKNTAKTLLKNDMIHFLGTDCHRKNTIYPRMPKILKKLKKMIGKEKVDILTNINPRCVVENEKIVR